MKIIRYVVTANIAGRTNRRAQGISIYFPKNEIHISYSKTKFAQESLWLEFLQEYI